jgi:hypothetical protein
LCLKLAAWVVLLEAANVLVDAISVTCQRWILLGHGIAKEPNYLLAKCWVIDVQCPRSRAIVRVNIDLALGRRAV